MQVKNSQESDRLRYGDVVISPLVSAWLSFGSSLWVADAAPSFCAKADVQFPILVSD